MSVVTQLPADFGGAAGKVCYLSIHEIARYIVICPGSIYRYRRLTDTWQFCLSLLNVAFVAGTFRPDRIRSIADRFGVNGDMALENILYGMLASIFPHSCLTQK